MAQKILSPILIHLWIKVAKKLNHEYPFPVANFVGPWWGLPPKSGTKTGLEFCSVWKLAPSSWEQGPISVVPAEFSPAFPIRYGVPSRCVEDHRTESIKHFYFASIKCKSRIKNVIQAPWVFELGKKVWKWSKSRYWLTKPSNSCQGDFFGALLEVQTQIFGFVLFKKKKLEVQL